MGFGSDTIAAMARQVATQAPVAVRVAFGGTRPAMSMHLAMDGTSMFLSKATGGNRRTLDLRIAREQITGARRPAPNRIELSVKVPGDRLASSLRAIECDDVNVIERIVAWLPASVYQTDLIRQWYEQALGRYRREAWMTYAIAAVITIAFIAQAAASRALDFSPQALIAHGGNFAPATLGGEPWRLLLSIFLHGDIDHYVGNLFALLLLAPYAERVYGRAGFAAICLGAGLLASAVDLWTNFLVVSVGASGAIYGLLGALIAYALRRRGHLPMRSIRFILIAGSVYVLWSFIDAIGNPVINNSAHVSGFIAGALLGAWIAPPLVEASGRRRVLVLASASFATLVAAIAMNQMLVRALSSDWPVLVTFDDIARRAGSIDEQCQTAIADVQAGSVDDTSPFAAACVSPLEAIEQDLAKLAPADPILREELERRLAAVRTQLATNREAVATWVTSQGLSPAEDRRVAALDDCRSALELNDAGDLAGALRALDRDCVAGLDEALGLLPERPAGSPELMRYVHAARALWQAEREAYARVAAALREQDAAGVDAAAAALRSARTAFEAATGHRSTEPGAP